MVGVAVVAVPALILLAFVGLRFRIKDAHGHPVGSIRRPLFLPTYRITVGGDRRLLRLKFSRSRIVIEQDGRPPVIVVGDVSRQRYEFKSGEEYLARVFSYGLEPGPSFNVEVLSNDEPLVLIVLAVIDEFRSRPHGRVETLDGFGWFSWF